MKSGVAKLTTVFSVLATFAGTLAFADDFAIHDGDTIVFYGDSITENMLYPNFVETYIVTRYPNLHVRFVNAGWAGDTVKGGGGGPINDRLTRDVIAQN